VSSNKWPKFFPGQEPPRKPGRKIDKSPGLSWEIRLMIASRCVNSTLFALLGGALVGCGSAQHSAGDQPDAKVEASGSASATPASADAGSASPVTETAASAEPKDERVSFHSKNQGIAKFPGTKLNESIFEYKLYSDGSRKLDGKYTEFWSDGLSKFVDGEYVDNIRTGKRRYYHANGQLAREVTLSDGKPNGAWPRFREDGSKEMEVSYKSGKRDGVWRVYSSPQADAKSKKEPAKSPDEKTAAKAEVKTDKKSPPDVRLVTEGTYQDGRRDGPWITYHPNGQKAAETIFKADRKDGKEQTWYPSGKKMLEAEYKNGLLHGVATMWNEQGAVVLTREYKEGKLVPKSAKPTDQAAAK
jgi:antitoxin component YwqK of YwqJK toxin-antitoxin module